MQTLPLVSAPVVAFWLADGLYALPAASLIAVVEGARLARVPGAVAPYVAVLPWQGQLLPVMDLARRLARAPGQSHEPSVLVVVGPSGPIGLRVDRTSDIPAGWDFAWAPVSPPTLVVATGHLGPRDVSLLDLARLLAPPTSVG